MAAIDFPASPTVGQSFTAGNGVIYVWNGLLWVAAGSSAPGGDFMARYNGASFGMTGTLTPLVFDTVITGNSGGWYSISTGRYTPPAGRYCISGIITAVQVGTASWVGAFILKNGVNIQPATGNTSGASTYTAVPVSAIVDANGTDYFQIGHQASAAGLVQVVANNCSMWAFPISGIKGPPGDPGVNPGADPGNATTPLGANVALNNTTVYFNGPNTGLIGAAGQKWRISGRTSCNDGTGAVQFEARLWDGAAVLPGSSAMQYQGTAGGYTHLSCEAIVTLTAPTTFTLQARDWNFAGGTMFGSFTAITAQRLT